MPIRLCLTAGCPNPVHYRGYCEDHARTKERKRAGKSIYNTKRWQQTRKAILFDNPLCECGAIATDVHHKVDLADGGDPWSFKNLAALCASCHGKITRANQQTPPQR